MTLSQRSVAGVTSSRFYPQSERLSGTVIDRYSGISGQLLARRSAAVERSHEVVEADVPAGGGARRHEASLSWVSLDAVGGRRPRLAGVARAWSAPG